jgi:hypothetical protein
MPEWILAFSLFLRHWAFAAAGGTQNCVRLSVQRALELIEEAQRSAQEREKGK